MKRIAILGGGIAGVSAAYELARQKEAGAAIAFTLFEAMQRLGGIVETERRQGFVIECGPDSWVTEKPWARELAVELGLESEIIYSQDKRRKTYLAENGELLAMPDGMRMMVPFESAGVLNSPLFSLQAKRAYQREPQRANELKASALDAFTPPRDESVRDFVIRHFSAEVADTIAAPLLAGVFGGDIATLSARAVLPAFVVLEHKYGSLILGLQQSSARNISPTPIFSTLRNGLSGLIEGMEKRIPAESIRCAFPVKSIKHIGSCWRINGVEQFDAVIIATPTKMTAQLLAPLNTHVTQFLPQHSSSAIVVAFAFTAKQATAIPIPAGFGFLVPQRRTDSFSLNAREELSPEALAKRTLLACTFVDQKFPHRAPPGAVLLRAFFGGPAAHKLSHMDDATLSCVGHSSLKKVLGNLPEPSITLVRRWQESLPLYTVGHLERIAQLETWAASQPHLRLIGNAYRGVGLPDLVRDGRNTAREMVATLTSTSA